jgi:hypothetical protein
MLEFARRLAKNVENGKTSPMNAHRWFADNQQGMSEEERLVIVDILDDAQYVRDRREIRMDFEQEDYA